MTEPNPYDPPQTPAPLTRTQLVKRGLGVTIILLLTPPAMVITVMGTCAIARPVSGGFGMALVWGVPLAVLTGLMVWAMALDRPRPDDSNRKSSRAGIFLATPAVVAIAMVAGYVLAAAMILLPTTLRRYEWALQNAAYFFWPLPAVALLTMLIVAWRARGNSPQVGAGHRPVGSGKIPRLDGR